MMFPLRIKKAEVALSDGRLDEAYKQAIREDVRDHRKGQRLITRLTKAYAKRARVHLNTGNHSAAMADADRAYRLGGNQPEIVALRDQVKVQLNSRENQKLARQQKLATARRCLATGDYSLGARICKDVDDGNTVVGLMQDAEINRRIVDAAVLRGRQALKSREWELALDALDEAIRLQPAHTEVVALLREVTQAITKQVRQTIAVGRLDQADLLLNRLRRHAHEGIEVQELARVISQCRTVSTGTRPFETSKMIADLKALKQIIPEAKWLEGAINDAETVSRCVENLRTGPLGSLLTSANADTVLPSPSPHVVRTPSPKPRSNPHMRVYEATPVLPNTFLLHLDGTGSVLVTRNDSVTIGSQSRSRPVDVPIQGQVGLPTISIERMEEDYFFTSEQPLPVNGKPTTSTLLSSQDQIRIGRRGSMQFTLPNAASTSAMLDFAGVRLSAGNARRVILMDDSLVIGPQPSAHIQSLSLERAMVLHWRDGALRIRPMSRAMETEGAVLGLDQPHDIDGLSLVVTRVSGVV